MNRSHFCCQIALTSLVLWYVPAWAADEAGKTPIDRGTVTEATGGTLYHLGPGDEIRVQQPNAEELDGKVARIDDMGFATLPLVGKLQLGGLTVEQAQSLISSRLSDLLLKPEPIVSIAEYRSQPVSVVGAVNTPGVIQLQGRKTLMEMLSLAGGLRPDAGGQVEITREVTYGRVPAGKEATDPSGKFSTAKIEVAKILNGDNPSDNIVIFPHDVISIPRAELIYVTGEVHKPGGFPLTTNSAVSVLQAISLAEGLGPQASAKNAKIFRPRGDGSEKQEIPVNVAGILAGKASDVTLMPRDILFIPDSMSKKAGVRAAEAAIQTVTGVVIWRR
ncbi:MAG: SLBB domain-containing protein [Acidobacteriia bacterium]|nr:SLBB domain-containing protein [Terriglobia bacterium]